MFYQIDPELQPSMPTRSAEDDNLYNVPDDYTPLQLLIQNWQKEKYTRGHERQAKVIPRLLWVRKSWTLKELHHYVFKYLKQVFVNWLERSDDNNPKRIENLIEFPFTKADGSPLTVDEFKALTDEQVFDLCNSGAKD